MKRIELPEGALCELYEPWLSPDEAASVFAALHTEVPFESRTIRIFGREIAQPRLVAWVGDADAVYTYSRTRNEPLPWPPFLHALRTRVAAVAGVEVNSVLCNLYRDGQDSMGMHSDNEPELGSDPIIASLSLGATRKFCLRHRRGAARGKLDLPLSDGSLLIMRGSTQRHYRHGVPKEPNVTMPRINLTFRRVFRAREDSAELGLPPHSRPGAVQDR